MACQPEPPRSITYIDEHILALSSEWIHSNLRSRRLRLSGPRVPRPAMPRTDHFAAFDYALAERPPSVEAGIFHGADFAVDVGHADQLTPAGEFFDCIEGRKVGLGGEFDESHNSSDSAAESRCFASLRMTRLYKERVN